jgi:hypothetical protein
MGSWILYAKGLYGEMQLSIKKKELGKNLLVFPAHTMYNFNFGFDVDSLVREIKRIKAEYQFDSVTICLYCVDILRGLDKAFDSYGFNIVCAGYMTDPCFLRRLRTLIELSDVAMGNAFTKSIWYATSLGKPFYLWKDENFNSIPIHKDVISSIPEVFSAFGEYTESFTDEQREIIDKYCDVKSFKSPTELRSIFEESERLYNEGNYLEYQSRWAYRKQHSVNNHVDK